LTLIMILPFVGTFFFLHYQKGAIRELVLNQILPETEEEDLVLLKFSKADSKTKLRWSHSNEFKYNRKLYDVVDFKIVGDSVYFWCWWDNKETELDQQLMELVNYMLGNNQQGNNEQHFLRNIIKGLCIEKGFDWNAIRPEKHARIQLSIYKKSYSSRYIPTPSPPPWEALS